MESNFYLIKRLFKQYIISQKKILLFSIISMVIVAACNGLNAYLIQPMLDKIFIQQDHTMLFVITFVILGVSMIKGISDYFQSFFMKVMGQKIITNMQIELYQHLIYSDLSYINSFSSGKLISRFTNDINIMRASVSTILTGVARDMLSLIFLVGVMFYQSFLLSVLAFIVFPLFIYPVIRLGKRMKKIANKTQEELGNYTVQLDETFRNLRIIKSYTTEEYEVGKAKKIMNNILELYTKASRTASISSPIMETISGVAIATVVWYGGRQVITGETTAGSFFSFVAALIMAYKPMKTLADLNTSLQEGLAAAKRFFTLMDLKPEIVSNTNKQLKISNGEIIFENVKFSYPNNKAIFNDFSIIIPANKTVAFVGESGSGKSTLLNLILRMYEIEKGQITIDHQEIRDVTLQSLRKNISIVTQEVAIFDDSLKSNIAYGSENINNNAIINAAKIALVDEFAKTLPNGYDEMIGQQGAKVSGGQRQRIAIARAILKDAPILILDEATSHLDNIIEAKIMLNIRQVRKNKTTIIVAHRLSTIIDADIIYVMKNGQVVEKGNHNELINQDSYYKKLYNKSVMEDE